MKGAAAGSSSWSAESGEGSARGSSNGCEWEGEGDRGREGEREAELMEGSWEESGSTTAPGHGLIRRLDYLEQTSYSTLYLTLYFKLYSVVQSTVQNNTLHGRLRSLLEMALGYQHLYGLLGGLLGCAFLFCSPFFFFLFFYLLHAAAMKFIFVWHRCCASPKRLKRMARHALPL